MNSSLLLQSILIDSRRPPKRKMKHGRSLLHMSGHTSTIICARESTKTKDEVIQLVVADHMKASLSSEGLEYIRLREGRLRSRASYRLSSRPKARAVQHGNKWCQHCRTGSPHDKLTVAANGNRVTYAELKGTRQKSAPERYKMRRTNQKNGRAHKKCHGRAGSGRWFFER